MLPVELCFLWRAPLTHQVVPTLQANILGSEVLLISGSCFSFGDFHLMVGVSILCVQHVRKMRASAGHKFNPDMI